MTKLAVIKLQTERFENMKKQAGFTLIELIMVIVILGILSAFALPRFADLSGDAEEASVQGAFASIKSAAAIVHASALANNQTGASGTVALEGTDHALITGYPDAGGDGTDPGVLSAAGISANDYAVFYNNATQANATSVIIAASQTVGSPCAIYTEGNPPTINYFEDDGTNNGLGDNGNGFADNDQTCN
jgi:MSHA pilin protein MshA